MPDAVSAPLPIVRAAEHHDIPWLYTQLQAFNTFFGSRKSLMPSDKATATDLLLKLVDTQPVFVAEVEAHPVGFIAGVLGPHFLNPEIAVLTELFWWVPPERRRTGAGAVLLTKFLDYGHETADWIIMTLEAHSPVNPDVLTWRGFRHTETNYLLEVPR